MEYPSTESTQHAWNVHPEEGQHKDNLPFIPAAQVQRADRIASSKLCAPPLSLTSWLVPEG